MNSKRILKIMEDGQFPHPFTQRKLVETHISYVILGTRLAYKFKKEIKYSFVDFSTLRQRKYFCEREVELNNRLSKGVYLGVVPVRTSGGIITVDGHEGKIIDYAVKMKRLRDDRQMHVMLSRRQVNQKHIHALARTVRRFHDRAEVVHHPFRKEEFSARYNDILSVRDFIRSALGDRRARVIDKAIEMSDAFLEKHRDLFESRVRQNFIRDCHGDLHSRNIFLYAEPIIFDCLEFNDAFRRMDVLDEIAFFCMDLEAENRYDLSEAFLKDYFRNTKNEFNAREQILFTYYKSYRANVRAKVNALRAMKPGEVEKDRYLDEVRKYLLLLKGYV